MRIYGPNGTTPGAPAGGARRAGTTGFSLPDMNAAAETRAPVAPRAAAGIDALLALQGVEDPVERRKRSVQRGRGALDVLDELDDVSNVYDNSELSDEEVARLAGE